MNKYTPLLGILFYWQRFCALQTFALKCVLGDNNENLGHSSSAGHAVLEHRHREFQFNFLWALQTPRQIQYSLAVHLLDREIVLLGLLDAARHPRAHQLQIEFRAIVEALPLQREQSPALRRNGHLGGERDEIMRIGGGFLEALQVIVVAHH